ncbi:DoxX family protein [Bosea sp. RAF48]|uniref:DoxX family protein n=1 Tax=Bosea sp. RAF48 TaxID=3237480 RepID=UPI003F8E8427
MNNVGLLVGRLMLVVLYLVSGFGKWGNLTGTAAVIAAKGFPSPFALAVIAAAAEVLGASAVALGVLPRLAALGLAVYTIVTAVVFHAFWGVPDAAAAEMQTIHFLKNLGLAGGFLILAGVGAGRLALMRNRRLLW